MFLKGLVAVRAEERRDTWTAFALLFLFIGSHAMLETARDALFLSKIPATKLPWVYLAIAAMSLLVMQVQARVGRTLRARRALALWIFVAALVTGGFWLTLPALGAGGLYGLYVWSGVLTSLVLVHFWTLLGDTFSVTQAKRLYGVIGAGSVLGAIVGSGAAGAVAGFFDARHLLAVSALGLALAAMVSFGFASDGASEEASPDEAARSSSDGGILAGARYLQKHPYARHVAYVLVAAAVGLTLTDYLFKSTIAESVPADELGETLGLIYFALNIASLGAQLFVVSWLLRRFGLVTALMVLPALLLFGAVGLIISAGLVSAMLLKGADGSLRYTLQRTSTELLFVPLSDSARRRVKAFIDVAGQRGGQAVASIAILIMASLSLPSWVATIALFVVLGLWLSSVLRLRGHYLELFRGRLRHSATRMFGEFQELDIASLETLVASLDSEHDQEVIAALGVLEREGRSHLVPALILYHPSDDVVVAALELFARTRRRNVVRIARRLFEHPAPSVRSAAILAATIIEPDHKKLWMRLSFEESAEVRATLVINLIVCREIVGEEARERIEDLLARGSAEARTALARAIAAHEDEAHYPVLGRLCHAVEPEVRVAALRAMAPTRSDAFVQSFIELLGHEQTRDAAAAALEGYGEIGFRAVVSALEDQELPISIRWHLPRVLTRFEAQPAAEALLARLVEEPDGMVRYRLIRALEEQRRQTPDVRLDDGQLTAIIDDTLSAVFRSLDHRVILERAVDADAGRDTDGYRLLGRLLRDKQDNAFQRCLRLLGLAHPAEDFRRISRGLESGDRELVASSRELLESVLKGRQKQAIVALIDDGDDAARLASGRPYHEPLDVGFEPLLEILLTSASRSVAEVTTFYVGELRLTALSDVVASLPHSADVELSLARLLEPSRRSRRPEVTVAP